LGYDIRLRQSVEPQSTSRLTGGVTDLFEFIGHCEKELTIGTLDRTRRALPPPIDDQQQLASQYGSYYLALGQPWRVQLDRALDQFFTLQTTEVDFWEAFQARVNEALENEFYEEIVIRTKVKQKLVAPFERHIQTFAEWSRSQFELSGVLPMLQLSSPASPMPEPANMIRKDDRIWTIRYAGTTVQLPHLRGFDYLAYLMCNPYREYEVQALDRIIRGNMGPGAAAASALGLTESDGYRIDDIGDAGDLTDARTINAARAHLRELESELRNARASGVMSEVARMQDDLELIKRYLRETVDHRGRPRKAKDPKEKARINIQRLIRRAIENIEDKHPALAAHLKTAVRTGHFCAYDPPPSERIAWTC
jgi:hypothetical protein